MEISGFDRAAISVLASDVVVRDRLGALHKSVAEIEDDSGAPLADFTSSDSLVEAESAEAWSVFSAGIPS